MSVYRSMPRIKVEMSEEEIREACCDWLNQNQHVNRDPYEPSDVVLEFNRDANVFRARIEFDM